MIIQSLQFLSADVICYKLPEYYVLCRKYSLKIPNSIAFLIFERFREKKFMKTEKQLQFFQAEILSLEKIHIDRTIFNHLNLLKNFDGNCLKEIDLSYYDLSKNEAKNIGGVLVHCLNIETINLTGNRNMSHGFSKICLSLIQSKKLKILNLSDCNLKVLNGKSLHNLLRNCMSLNFLLIKKNKQLPFDFGQAFEKNSKVSTTLTTIDVSYSIVDDNQSENFEKMLCNCSNIQKINYSHNFIRKEGFFQSFLKDSKIFTTLTDISFSNCKFNQNQYEKLIKFMNNCQQIESVDLSGNHIIQKNVINIFNNLNIASYSITELNLSNCSLSESYFNCTNDIKFTSITSFSIKENGNIGNGFFNVINMLLESRKCLRSINFSDCNLRKYHSKRLQNFFIGCKVLEEVHLRGNDTLGEEYSYIFNSMYFFSSTLKFLDLAYNNLLDCSSSNLVELLNNLRQLEALNLDGNQDISTSFHKICQSLEKFKYTLRLFYAFPIYLDKYNWIKYKKFISLCPNLQA